MGVLGLFATSASAQKLYRWIDENGVVQYSDHVPPEAARQDRDLLNEQGILVGSEQGEITDEERAQMEAEAAAEAARVQAIEDARRRDRILLDTYLSVEDIEKLRDRRLELIESQIKVTEIYLGNLTKKLEGLNRDAQRFAPYSDRENAPPIPENLSLDIARTESSIALFEQRLNDSRTDQEQIRRAFAQDIERFRELKGI
ncbi:MAG: DUF4124 domain-containing protein [Gammaproteobacteria bacterium]|nr:DUF4124 domain-containing protein [Gammaproteobacteria bacterium]